MSIEWKDAEVTVTRLGSQTTYRLRYTLEAATIMDDHSRAALNDYRSCLKTMAMHAMTSIWEQLYGRIYKGMVAAIATHYSKHQNFPVAPPPLIPHFNAARPAMADAEAVAQKMASKEAVARLNESNEVTVRVVIGREGDQRSVRFYRDGQGEMMIENAADYFETIFLEGLKVLMAEIGGKWVNAPPSAPTQPPEA